MSCLKCGEVCSCFMEPSSNSSASDSASVLPAAAMSEPREDPAPGPASEDAWRGELSARLHRYRTKRKAPPPRYPSLKLPFENAQPSPRVDMVTAASGSAALDPVSELAPQQPVQDEPRIEEREAPRPDRGPRQTAKIIEFPSFAWEPSNPPRDQLAEPVMDRPRILEVPEVAPPPPALGGITIEPVPQQAPQKRLGIDIPLQSAPLGRRLAASAIDGVIVAAASALFGYIFWKIAGVQPPRFQMLGLTVGMPCLFWAAYQYLLLVYSASTPGLRLTKLELTRFDGVRTSRAQRRWRVLASYLSAVSLGMGYLWIFLDEDVLCWHDRTTRTYLARRETAKQTVVAQCSSAAS